MRPLFFGDIHHPASVDTLVLVLFVDTSFMPGREVVGEEGLTHIVPNVYTIGMKKSAVINLKTDPQLKDLAAKTADRLGISLSAVLNNELRRFTAEQSVVFEVPEVPNTKTGDQLVASQKLIKAGDYYQFETNKKSFKFLADELR